MNLTDKGIMISSNEAGETPQYGKITSAPYQLNFQSNVLKPMWRYHADNGNNVFIEISRSADGKNWEDWVIVEEETNQEMMVDLPSNGHDRNTGYSSGNRIDFGNNTSKYVRFRVTLFSDQEYSPVFESFKLKYVYMTLTDGKSISFSGIENH